MTLRISFTGDIALNGGYEDVARQAKEGSLAASIEPLLAGSDLAIGNLEGPLTNHESAGPSWRFCLHGNPVYTNVLASAGIHAVTLANNHAMDHGWQGLCETQEVLDAAGIKHVGAGLNLREARKPLQLVVKDVRVGILAYCDVPTGSPLYAGRDQPGVAPLRREFLFEDIATAKHACDILILCIHWGQEDVREPAPKHRRLAREMIRAGANIVVGHHPHVLQGTERVGRGSIAYSLGNFTFSEQQWHGMNRNGEAFSMPYRLSEANRRSAVWRVVVDPKTGVLGEDLRPVYLGPNLLPVADARPDRKVDFQQNNAALEMYAYGLRWTLHMIRARFLIIARQLREQRPFGGRLLRLRPRHLRELMRFVAREWEQFRGTEQH